MAQDPLITIGNVQSLDRLIVLENNLIRGNAVTQSISEAINSRYADFGREMIVGKSGVDLSEPTPAEASIVNAIGRYVALQKRDGKGAERTFRMIANRGLIDAAEVTVAKSKVTQGFEVLDQADMRALSFEQIIVDHSDEFSARALWYARRTLGLPNDSEKPPADLGTLTQQRTERLFDWLTKRASGNQGRLASYTNADVGAVLGFDDLTRHGRVLGNITSRIDFACYREGLPPLGLCANHPFANAWAQEGRSWAFPVQSMQAAAHAYSWSADLLEHVRRQARLLPGQAAIPWRQEIFEHENGIRSWAEGLADKFTEALPSMPPEPGNDLTEIERNLLSRKPAVRERVSKWIERGSIGAQLKRACGFRCQICEAIGLEAIGFIKSNGEPYVEAHHATPVSELEIGSLSATNIMILCANHHRQMHYGNVELKRMAGEFVIRIDEREIRIKRFGLILT